MRDNLNVWGEAHKSKYFFSTPIEKEVTNIDKDGNESVVTISYKIKFIDSARIMASSLSSLVHNFAEEIHKIKSKDFFSWIWKCQGQFDRIWMFILQ